MTVVCAWTHVCTHTPSHTHTHTRSAHSHTHTHTHTHTHNHTQSHTHTHTHTHTHRHTHTHKHAHAHTHTHTLSLSLSLTHTHTHTRTVARTGDGTPVLQFVQQKCAYCWSHSGHNVAAHSSTRGSGGARRSPAQPRIFPRHPLLSSSIRRLRLSFCRQPAAGDCGLCAEPVCVCGVVRRRDGQEERS